MITIQSGKMIIPEEERFVGFAGDDHSCIKQFILLDDADLDSIYTLYLRFDDDRVTSAPLSAEIGENGLILTWDVRARNLLKSGIVMAQLKITDSEDEVAHTGWDYFVVGASAEFADDGSELDILHRTEFEERMAQAVSDARATAPYIGEDGYWYVYSPAQGEYVRSYSANHVTIDTEISASGTNPVQNRAIKTYVDTLAASKVDKTTHIAGLPLDGHISSQDLFERLEGKINPPMVVIGVTYGHPGQYGMTIDSEPVFSNGISNWEILAKASDLPTKTSDLQNDSGFLTSHQDVSGKENSSNKVTALSSSSTDSQYPSAKCIYDLVGNLESLLAAI